MRKRMPREEDMFRENIKREVVLSPFIMFDRNGEAIFHTCPPCPRCDGMMGGKIAGSFACEFCGYDEVEKYSSTHAMSLSLECTWKFLRPFIHNKRLRWIVSEKLYDLHASLTGWYRSGRHQVSITNGDYMWSWKDRKWFKFM